MIIRFITLCIISSGALFLYGCSDEKAPEMAAFPEQVDDIFTAREWNVIQRLSPLPEAPPPNPTNRVADDPEAAQLGQMFFFDVRFSKDGTVACATCHSPFHGFADVEATSLGAGRGTRNAPTLLNVAYNQWQFWDGRADTLWSQALSALEGEAEQAGTRLQYAHLIHRHYAADYEIVFGALPELENTTRFPTDGKPDGPTFDNMSEVDQHAVNTVFANIGKAIEAYERLLISRNAPFDRFVAGDTGAISRAAKRGLKTFIGKGVCILCHDTPTFTDDEFHNLGVPQGTLPEDTGRYTGISLLLADPFNGGGIYSDDTAVAVRILNFLEPIQQHQGEFKTPTLRNVALTAPYFHTGEFPTLESVIEFNNVGGTGGNFAGQREGTLEPLGLSEQEKADLVEFLETLTGELPPTHLLTKPNLP
ncbi:cytochrome-c peroxidase [Candidatus Poribacteria bacterium]|nr:cytochrome-c peroxidase [Candidatus Poribacteria bacterium]MYG08295.1 cytochrome-c peroxidase [Candidatus Poribacteria bacterium]MYK21980.1 cytochrome-c peroxidase [Candidatus Poribacteria bacterium]